MVTSAPPLASKKRFHPGEFVDDMCFDALKGVNAVFINMPLRESAVPNTPPQGPGLMAARLRQYGANPFIIDLNAYRIKDDAALRRGLSKGRHLSMEEAEKLLRAHFHKYGNPDVIALSGMITTLKWQSQVAKVSRRLMPEAFLVSGGGLAAEVKQSLFDWIPELDAIAHSEGDDVMLLLARDVKCIREKGMESAFSSPYYIGKVHGIHRFIYGGDRPRDLDVLPFAAWDLLEEDVYGNPILESLPSKLDEVKI
jgi:hypothetical protein